MRLAAIYQQLGRPVAFAAIVAKIRTLGATNETALAGFFEQYGQLEEAAAIYQKLAEQSADAQSKAFAWQSLANLDARQGNYGDAVSATRQALAALQSSDNPGIRNQTLWMRQNLAASLRQAGQLDQADQIYRQLVQENWGGPQEDRVLANYAQSLVSG